MNITLDEKTAIEIGGALARVQEIEAKKIIETGDAAEKRGLQGYLAKALVDHAPELLGCWFTVRNQYRPLVQGFAALIQNADHALSRVRARATDSEWREPDEKAAQPAKE